MKHLILLVVLFTQLFSAQKLEKVTLQLQWYDQFQFAGYYMAKEKGFYADAGLDVEIKKYRSNINPVEQVISGKTNYATGRSSLVIDRAKGKDVVALAAIFQSSPLALVVKSDSGIHTIEDLNGKRIGGDHTIINTISMHAMLLNKGISVNYISSDNTKSDIENLLDGNVDAILIYKTNETYTLTQTNVKYRVFSPANYGFNFYSDILFTNEYEVNMHPQRTTDFKNASLKGWEYAFSHIDETVQLILDKYNTQNKTRKALTYEADELRKLAYYRTDKIGKITDEKIQRIYEIYTRTGVIDKSIDIDAFIFGNEEIKTINFTAEEKIYLKDKKEITICGKKDLNPYINFSGKKPQGIVPDLVEVYESIIGIPIKYVKTSNWNECIKKTENREVDVVDMILTNPNTHQYLTPSKAYIFDFLVLASKTEKPYIGHISDADDLSVAIVGEYKSLIHYIRTHYPNLHLIYVKDRYEGLGKVSNGQVDTYMGLFMPTRFLINKKYTKELKINERFNRLELDGGFGIRSDAPLLVSIFNKAIDTLEPKIKREIINSWINVKDEQTFNSSLFWKILFIIALMIFILNYRQYLLKKEHKKLQTAYDRINKQQIKLKEQKTIYELVFNSTRDGVLMLENGKFISCNQPIVAMLGYNTKQEVLDLTPSALSPKYQPDGRLSSEKADEMISIAFKNGVNRFEWIHTKKTGEDFWAEITLTPIVIDNKKLLHVIWRDISERKKLEQDKADLKEQMEMAFSASRDGLWDWDIKSNSVYFSPRWKEMLGYRDDELENLFSTWQDRLHPEDLERTLKDIELHLARKTDVYENKHRLRHKDGHWVWILDRGKTQFNNDGEPIRMIGTHTDLTNEINLTTELNELNQTLEIKIEAAVNDLKKSQEQAKLGSWQHNIADHKLIWSDETYHIFELEKTSEIASYENFLAAIHPDDIEKIKAAYAHSLKTQEPYEIVHRLLMTDGRIKYVREHCETTFDSAGNALVSIGTIQDITSKYLAAQKLREKKDMLFKQSRLAQMGEMISMIAHQWRQPLAAISASTNTLILKNERGGYESELFKDRLQKIANYSQHLSTTIDDFRNFFKTNKEKEETTVEAVIEDVLHITRTLLESENINIITDFQYNKKVNIYANELKQVVLNLIKNAEDILLENKVVAPKITVRTFEEDGYSVLSIEDNGGGIDNAIIDKVFDPYFSTKLDKEGTGLGLYMSKIIVQEHCTGTLTVKNSRNGAIFRIQMRGKDV